MLTPAPFGWRVTALAASCRLLTTKTKDGLMIGKAQSAAPRLADGCRELGDLGGPSVAPGAWIQDAPSG